MHTAAAIRIASASRRTDRRQVVARVGRTALTSGRRTQERRIASTTGAAATIITTDAAVAVGNAQQSSAFVQRVAEEVSATRTAIVSTAVVATEFAIALRNAFTDDANLELEGTLVFSIVALHNSKVFACENGEILNHRNAANRLE